MPSASVGGGAVNGLRWEVLLILQQTMKSTATVPCSPVPVTRGIYKTTRDFFLSLVDVVLHMPESGLLRFSSFGRVFWIEGSGR